MARLAKSSLLNGAKGKIGGQSVYTDSTGTIMRKADSNVKNANTLGQRVQRVIMKSVNANYKKMKAICDHSFEGYAIGRDCMNRFNHLNAKQVRVRAAEIQNLGGSLYDYYNFMPIGSEDFMPFAAIISDGQLPKIQAAISDNLAVMPVATNTYKGVMDAYNLQRGDQLTFITVSNDDGIFNFNYSRVILDPRDADGDVAPLSTPFIEDEMIVKPNNRNRGTFGILQYHQGLGVVFCHTNGPVAAAGVIVSRKFEGSWLRSYCKLVISEENLGSSKKSLMAAAEQEPTASIEVESEQYLNNAGVGGAAGESSPATGGGGTVTPSISNTVKINNVNQNVSGGSIQISSPLTSIKVTGVALDTYALKVNGNNMSLNGEKTEATWSGNVALGSSATIQKSGSTWFTVACVEDDNDGPSTEGN